MKKIKAIYEGVVTCKPKDKKEYQFMSFVKKAEYDKDSKALTIPTSAFKVYLNDDVKAANFEIGKVYPLMIEADWKTNAMVID